jgi:hypothetical protein
MTQKLDDEPPHEKVVAMFSILFQYLLILQLQFRALLKHGQNKLIKQIHNLHAVSKTRIHDKGAALKHPQGALLLIAYKEGCAV